MTEEDVYMRHHNGVWSLGETANVITYSRMELISSFGSILHYRVVSFRKIYLKSVIQKVIIMGSQGSTEEAHHRIGEGKRNM